MQIRQIRRDEKQREHAANRFEEYAAGQGIGQRGEKKKKQSQRAKQGKIEHHR